MTLPKTLSIEYPLSPKQKINTGFDEQIENFLAKLGYRRWASGYTYETRMRDLAFDLRQKPC